MFDVSMPEAARTSYHVTNTDKQNIKSLMRKKDKTPHRELPSRYTLEEQIGQGAFSTVHRAFDNVLNMPVAIKIINKTSMKKSQMEVVMKEVAIMRRLDHPNVVKLLDYINSDTSCFIIMEYVSGTELFNQIVKLTYFSEDLSRHIIVQVVKAVDYLHSEVGVVHRDIKPENLLYEEIDFIPGEQTRRQSDDTNKAEEGLFRPDVGGGTVGRVKLADFGLSKVLWDSNTKTPCGTASYTAPEIVKDESYSKSVDMWAVGCVLYTLLCGFPPFYDSDPKTLTLKVSRGEYTFLSPWWDEISKEAKDLVSHLLTVDPMKRYSPDDVLSHPWILMNSRPTNPAPDAPMYQTNSDSVLRFEQVIPNKASGPLSPRAEALKIAFDNGMSIQRTATPLRRLLEEDEYFDESDDGSSEDGTRSDDGDDEDDGDDDDDDDIEPDENQYVYMKSPVMRKFSNHGDPLPLTPYVTLKKKVVEGKESAKVEQVRTVAVTERKEFTQLSSFQLNFDGNTLLNRRKMSGSLGCGPCLPRT